jgi:hypothetical protein
MRVFPIILTGAILAVVFSSCTQEEAKADPSQYTCKTLPSFVRGLGFDPRKSAFSTSEKQVMGLVLKEFNDTGNRIYQHPGWKQAGWLSVLQLDKFGNIFTAPAPFISVLDNPVAKQNTLYRVGANDQLMTAFIDLPLPTDSSGRNPFGIMGIAYNCRNNLLYVSSIAGSDLQAEKGCLYVIDAATKEIIDRYEGKDFFGLEICIVGDKPMLLAGSTRTSQVFQFKLNSKGKLSSGPEQLIDLTGAGPRGDDKARKIVLNNDGVLVISGLQFSYNLIASTERPETTYYYKYDPDQGKWLAVQ